MSSPLHQSKEAGPSGRNTKIFGQATSLLGWFGDVWLWPVCIRAGLLQGQWLRSSDTDHSKVTAISDFQTAPSFLSNVVPGSATSSLVLILNCLFPLLTCKSPEGLVYSDFSFFCPLRLAENYGHGRK